MPSVDDWGLRDYSESLDAMRSLVRAQREGLVPDTLVLVEHPAVVTVGVEGDDGLAAVAGLPVVAVERGGHATYHGPGQQVGYPIVDLGARARDVRRFVRDVEEVIVRAVAPFGVHAGHVSGRPGVWVDGERKIASIGIAVDHWVTFHGFALNVNLDLTPFERFRPCGFDGSVMTSLSRETGHPVDLGEVRPHLVDAWNQVFAPARGPAHPSAFPAAAPLPGP